VLILSVVLLACSGSENTASIKNLKIGVLPDHHPEKIHARYVPLLDYLRSETGIAYELVTPSSYQELLDLFGQKKIDVAFFGGATYVLAHKKYNAVPLVSRLTDSQFKSMVIVKTELPARTLHELKGMTFAFGSELSTSGHFMPRHFFSMSNIVPEEFFGEVMFSGAHDKTAEWVRDGKVQAGVVNSVILHEMFLDGNLNKKNIRVLWESPPYVDYVWGVQKGLDEEVRNKIQTAFLGLSKNDPQQKKVLEALGASYYLPALHDDFVMLEKVILNN
jgi:phosphonate transport system substrate-binding protein